MLMTCADVESINEDTTAERQGYTASVDWEKLCSCQKSHDISKTFIYIVVYCDIL